MLPAGAALERILEHTGYLALAATTAGGVEAGDLLHAIDRVRQVVEDGQSLAAAAAALEDDREASSEVESLPLEPGQSDVVRVMNLHKAKGLEAPVVFLADPCGGFKPRVDVRIVRDGLIARGLLQHHQRLGPRREGAGRTCRLGSAQAGGADVSRGGGASAALRVGDPCPRPARRGPMGEERWRWRACMGGVRALPCAGCLSSRFPRRSARQPRSRRTCPRLPMRRRPRCGMPPTTARVCRRGRRRP